MRFLKMGPSVLALALGLVSLVACRSGANTVPDRSSGMGRPAGRPVEAAYPGPSKGLREIYYWNGHNDTMPYRAFESGRSGGVDYPDLTTKIMTETGRVEASFGDPAWRGVRGYWDVRFKDGPFGEGRTSNTALDPDDSVVFTFSVVPSDENERQATYGEDYRFLASDWTKNGYPATGGVLQPDDPGESPPRFTQRIPASNLNGGLPIYGVKIRFQVCRDDELEAPETFWTRVDDVRIEPGSSTRIQPGTSKHGRFDVSRSIMRLVIVDEESPPSPPAPAAPGFHWEPAPLELWSDLADVPTRLVSETGSKAEVPVHEGVAGECYAWRLKLPGPTPVTGALTLEVKQRGPGLPSGPGALAARSDFNLFYDHGGGQVRAVQVRSNPLTFAVRLPKGVSSVSILLQAVDDEFSKEEADVGAEAVYIEAVSVKALDGAHLFEAGEPALVRFLIVEEGPVRGRRSKK